MRADRLLSLVMLLQTRGKMTAETLARELGVSRRTILRDMDVLSGAGIPIYADGGHGGGIALDEHYRLSLTGLKADEATTLFVASNARLLRDVGLGEAAESTLLKLFTALPALHQPSVDQMRQRILIDPLWWWHGSQSLPFWPELQQAVSEDRCLRVVYAHWNGERVERVLEPYSLVAKASLWYLVGRRDGELRTYRVSRFKAVTLLDQHFERAPDFDLPTWWQERVNDFLSDPPEMGFTFTLRLDSARLPFAQLLMPRYDVVEPEGADGWLTLRFWTESVELAAMFVFGLGAQAVIVEPSILRDSVLTVAREVVRRYENG